MNPGRIARVAAGAVTVVIAFASPPSTSRATPPQVGEVLLPGAPHCFGEYRNAADSLQRIVIEPMDDPTFVRVRTSAGWGAVGFLDVDRFEGVMRAADLQGAPLPGSFGRLEFELQPDGSVEAVLLAGGDARVERWVLLSADRTGHTGELDELPRAVRRPGPAYPDGARRARIEGTVMVGALVGTDGRVLDTKILRSVPQLDAAAVAAVKQWKFAPGASNGRPVQVWVAVPVKFALK